MQRERTAGCQRTFTVFVPLAKDEVPIGVKYLDSSFTVGTILPLAIPKAFAKAQFAKLISLAIDDQSFAIESLKCRLAVGTVVALP